MSVYFFNDFGLVTFTRAPLYPEGANELLQATAESTGGEPVSRNPLAQILPMTLHWQGMSKANLDELLLFFETGAKGMARAFTYIDAESITMNARFAAPKLTYTEIAFERYDVTTPLFIE